MEIFQNAPRITQLHICYIEMLRRLWVSFFSPPFSSPRLEFVISIFAEQKCKSVQGSI